MALKCFLPCVFQNVWPSDNHNYALHSVVSHTKCCDLQNQQVADCFLLCVCGMLRRGGGRLFVECVETSVLVVKKAETFRQLTANVDVLDAEQERRKIHSHVFPRCVYGSND